METFQGLFDTDRAMRILDVGTGRGGFISMIVEVTDNYDSIIGIDTSDEAIAMANKSFNNDKISFIEMDALNMSFEDNSFDMVCLSNSLHHLTDVKGTLVEMCRVLKPGGMILINEMYSDVFNQRQMSHVLYHHFWAEVDRLNGVTHNETFKRIEVLDVLEKESGLTVDNSWDMDFGMDMPLDEESKMWLKDTLKRSLKRVESLPEYNQLEERAKLLEERLEEVGFESAPQMMVVLKK